MGWLIRLFYVVAGFIASFFISRDELQFEPLQLAIAVILFTLIVAVLAFWPSIKAWFKSKRHS